METRAQEAGYANVVDRVEWLLTGVDGSYEARAGGTTILNPVQPGGAFIDYQSLTEVQVLAWVHDVLGADEVARLEASIADQIAYQQNPPVAVLPLPWG